MFKINIIHKAYTFKNMCSMLPNFLIFFIIFEKLLLTFGVDKSYFDVKPNLEVHSKIIVVEMSSSDQNKILMVGQILGK